MAITPTGAIYKALEFDGVSSRDYGVYITGSAVFNAPERDVEMITIPGRNGAFALDNGRFQNIEVSYPAGIFADNESDFAEAISEFRNYLCSKRGYCRLQDEYNPDEYRLAIYKSGLEVEPAFLKAGEFTITFECKPQRFLTSGEEKETIASSGDTITNPTLFESSPLLEVFGNGNIGIGDQSISVLNATLDNQVLHNGYTSTSAFPTSVWISLNLNLNAMQPGDAFHVDNVAITEEFTFTQVPSSYPILMRLYADGTPMGSITENSRSLISNNVYRLEWKYSDTYTSFIYGTPSTATSVATYIGIGFKNSGGSDFWFSRSYTFYADYDGDKKITFYIDGTNTFNLTVGSQTTAGTVKRSISIGQTIGVPSLANLTKYIDLDIGECYAYQAGQIISWNSAAVLPSDLPTLVPGSNTITFDNTITDLKIVPRWWKV